METTAIDLYSGVGGWDLGLRMAGIGTNASFEWWDEANLTHRLNLGSATDTVDIRRLTVESIPPRPTFVVGSPPCTQFSFSNRGGSGDIADGLKDVAKFLELVSELEPAAWAMENVPRVARIIEKEVERGGVLYPFRDLFETIMVVDMAEYGLPQRRRRMIAGSFSQSLLESYRGLAPSRTLGDVVEALQAANVRDPIYQEIVLPATAVSGQEKEPPLTPEEERMNREAKTFHPVYNVMPFPDPLDRTARTVTALCTRVSRESIVIEDGRRLRRLTLRERASLQGFPVTFQFHGSSYGSRIKQIGNAVPPLMTYFIGSALLARDRSAVSPPDGLQNPHALPSELPSPVQVAGPKRKVNPNRRFRAAIPGLRFGSGVRFDLSNDLDGRSAVWSVTFFFGTSKKIISVKPDAADVDDLLELLRGKVERRRLDTLANRLRRLAAAAPGHQLQHVWAKGAGEPHPFEVVDALGEVAENVRHHLEPASAVLRPWLQRRYPGLARARIDPHAARIVAGVLISAWFNAATSDDSDLQEAV